MKSQLKWIRKRANKTQQDCNATGGWRHSAQQEHTICGKKRSTEVRDDRRRCADLRSAPVPPRLCKSQKSPHWTSLWPRSIPPDDAYFPTPVKSGSDAPCKRPAPAFEVIAAEGNGACLFRCFSMALQARAGAPTKAIVDSTESAMKLRDEILCHMELSLQ